MLPPAESALERALREKELEIRDRRVGEVAYLLDADGNVLGRWETTTRAITFSDAEVARMAGNILTHNHPDGGSFSQDDVYLAMVARLAEIRVVEPEYRYVMRPPEGGWSEQRWRRTAPIVRRVQRELYGEAREAYGRSDEEGDRALRALTHRLWERVAAETGVQYGRTRW